MLHKCMTTIGLSAAVLAIGGLSNATPIVSNGDFQNATPNTFFPPTGPVVPGWSVSGPFAGTCLPCVVIYGPGVGAIAPSTSPGGGLGLWAPADTSPEGGNYLASDSDPIYSRPITQSIMVTPGQTYELNFWYAAAQFRFADNSGVFGATDSGWEVTLAGMLLTNSMSALSKSVPGELLTTLDLSIPSQGFSGWNYASVTFTAPGTGNAPLSELLSFLAVGGPSPLAACGASRRRVDRRRAGTGDPVAAVRRDARPRSGQARPAVQVRHCLIPDYG